MKAFSPRTPRPILPLLGISCVLLFHTGAQAQQPPGVSQAEQGPAAPTGPAEAAPPPPPPASSPPPPYGPPPGYGNYYPPTAYYPPPPPPAHRGGHRPFTLGLGLGIGNLSFTDALGRANEPGLSYTLRFGFGITRRWLVWLGIEGTAANYVDSRVWQTGYLMGAQFFPTDHLYLRAGLGFAQGAFDDGLFVFDDRGYALMGAVGFEFVRGYHTALGLELAVTAAEYPGDETWVSSGINFVLHFY